MSLDHGFSDLFSNDTSIKKSAIVRIEKRCKHTEDQNYKKRFLIILIHLAYDVREVIKRYVARAISNTINSVPIKNDFRALEQFANHLILERTSACRIAAVNIWAEMAKQSDSRHMTDFLYDTISNIALDPSTLVREHVYKRLSQFGSISDNYKLFTIEFKPREREYVNARGDIKHCVPDLSNPGLFGVILQGLEDESASIRKYALDCIQQLSEDSPVFANEALYLVIDSLGDSVHSVRIRSSEVFLYLMKTYNLTLSTDDIDPISKVIRSPLHDIRQNIQSALKHAKLASLDDLLVVLESLTFIAQLHVTEKDAFLKLASMLGKNNKHLEPRLLAECKSQTYHLSNIIHLIPLAAYFNISKSFSEAFYGEYLFFKSKFPYLVDEPYSDALFLDYLRQFNTLKTTDEPLHVVKLLEHSLLKIATEKDYMLFLKQYLVVFTHTEHADFVLDIQQLYYCFYNYDKAALEPFLTKRPSKQEILDLLPLDEKLMHVKKYEVEMDYVQTTETTPIQFYYCMPNLFEFSAIVPDVLSMLQVYAECIIDDVLLYYGPCLKSKIFSGDVEYQFKIPMTFKKWFLRPRLIKTRIYCAVDMLEERCYSVSQVVISRGFPVTNSYLHYMIATPID